MAPVGSLSTRKDEVDWLEFAVGELLSFDWQPTDPRVKTTNAILERTFI
jgi:hypothetical protein